MSSFSCSSRATDSAGWAGQQTDGTVWSVLFCWGWLINPSRRWIEGWRGLSPEIDALLFIFVFSSFSIHSSDLFFTKLCSPSCSVISLILLLKMKMREFVLHTTVASPFNLLSFCLVYSLFAPEFANWSLHNCNLLCNDQSLKPLTRLWRLSHSSSLCVCALKISHEYYRVLPESVAAISITLRKGPGTAPAVWAGRFVAADCSLSAAGRSFSDRFYKRIYKIWNVTAKGSRISTCVSRKSAEIKRKKAEMCSISTW